MTIARDTLRNLSEWPFFDLLESEETYLYVIDLPGVQRDDLILTVDDGRLLIEAVRDKPTDRDHRYLEENRHMRVESSIALPSDAAQTGIDTSLSSGVLEVYVPKVSEPTETRIDIDD